MTPSKYLALYLAPLPERERAQPLPGALPVLASGNFFLEEGQLEVPPLSLPQLFTAGVECGHTSARIDLKHRLGPVHAQLANFRPTRSRPCGARWGSAGRGPVAADCRCSPDRHRSRR